METIRIVFAWKNSKLKPIHIPGGIYRIRVTIQELKECGNGGFHHIPNLFLTFHLYRRWMSLGEWWWIILNFVKYDSVGSYCTKVVSLLEQINVPPFTWCGKHFFVLVTFSLLRKNTCHSKLKKEMVIGSQFIEISVHNQLVLRQSGMTES